MVLVVLLSAAISPTSHAQGARNEALSRARFEEASKLEGEGDWARACPLYQEAHDLNATGGTALRAANCYEQIGADERALPLYRFIVDRRATEKAERVAIAESRIRVIEDKLRRGKSNPGSAAEQPPAAEKPPARGTAQPPASPPDEDRSPSRVPAIAAFSVGGAGLVVGAVFGVIALSRAGDVKTACETQCGAAEHQDADSATALGWVSNVGFGVAIVGAAAGVILLAVGGSSDASASRAVRPGVALAPQGVAWRF